ncbi:hypothetical protein EHM92_02405 [bacterium]|nr:MAG: hypothetical protein EHM92_02405 [bacterium]
MKIVLTILIAVVALGAGRQEFDRSEKEVITRTLQFPDGGTSRELVVDNINGSLDVVGYEGSEIQLLVHRTSYGESPEKLRKAKEKIRLDIREEPGKIILYVDAPWRCHDGSGTYRGNEYAGYDADFDFEIKVPSRCDVALSTVNKGEVTVENIAGAFEVSNVNGGIEMSGIAGAGVASTVNGKVNVHFRKNPGSRCGFRTVNGSIEVEVPDDLSADVKFKTFNGDMYSDFDVTGVPKQAPALQKFGKRTVYRGGEYSSVRAGNGGPEMLFETLNGDIRILKSHN